MDERPFADAARKPTDEAVRAALGAAYLRWSSLLAQADRFATEWNFGERSGWMLKVTDRRKALLYVIPLRDAFRLSLTIREGEREGFLADEDLATLHDRIREAKRYPEGYALDFEVGGRTDTGPLEAFIGKLVAVRSSGN